MPTFDTPHPITVTIAAVAAEVRIVAEQRADTVVDVRPNNSSAKSVKMAEQTRVEYDGGRLFIKTPKALNTMFSRPGAIDVEIRVPAGSSLDGETGMGDLYVDGPFGDCLYRTGYGRMRIDTARRVQVGTGAGEITVNRADGDAEVDTGAGKLRLGHIGGNAVIKSSTGGCEVGELLGSGRINGADGDITVDRAAADLSAKTANGHVTVHRAENGLTARTAFGDVRVGAAVRGTFALDTAAGRIEVGIPEGTAAWLDLNATGAVRNSLDNVPGPDESDERVEVRARTHWGDILIHRS